MSERAHTAERFTTSANHRRIRLALIVAAAIGAGLVVWLLFKSDGNGSSAPTRAPAAAASVTQLRALPQQVGHDVFWAGRKTGFTYELTQTSKGNIFVRYLPAGVEPNDQRPNFLTVGTYPRRGAFGVLQKVSKKPGSSVRNLAGGGIAVYGQSKPNSVYVAYPGKDLEIEIYAPSPSRALRLATSGQIRPLP